MKKLMLVFIFLLSTQLAFSETLFPTDETIFANRTKEQLIEDMLKALRPVDVIGKEKTRCGPNADGGYVFIDNLDYDTFYSYGIANDIRFEQAFLRLKKNKYLICHCYDHTIQSLPYGNHDRMLFTREGIGTKTTRVLDTLENHMKRNRDHEAKNAFLKIDVEGAEWGAFLDMPDSVLRRFKQIVIEFHGLGDNGCGYDLETKVAVLEKLNRFFHVVHVHGNNNCSLIHLQLDTGYTKCPWVLEVTYLRKDSDIQTKASSTSYPIKGLDFKNVPQYPEIQLDTYPFQPAQAE